MSIDDTQVAFKVRWSHGTESTYDSYDEAKEAVYAVHPDADIGHDGDISEGGRSTLCWPDEASVNDDGVRVCAKIVALYP